MRRMTKEEYSNILQTLVKDERFAGVQITSTPWGNNDVAMTMQFKTGEKFIFNTVEEFNRWNSAP